MAQSFADVLQKSIYTVSQRGQKTPLLVPRAGGTGAPGGMPVQPDVTVVGGKLISRAGARKFLEFQNNSLAQSMTITFGAPATTANGGDVITPGGSVRWEIEVPSEDFFVFCAVAGEPYSFQERLAS